MIRTLICTTALVVAMPAVAQHAQPNTVADPSASKNTQPIPAAPAESAAARGATTGSGSAAQPVPSSATPRSPSATPVPPSSTTTPATPENPSAAGGAAQPTPQAASGSQVAQVVEAEFPTYDADKSGQLDQNEFVAWMTALKKREIQATGKPMGDPEIASWAQGAFASADKDQSKTVSKAELLTYLGG